MDYKKVWEEIIDEFGIPKNGYDEDHFEFWVDEPHVATASTWQQDYNGFLEYYVNEVVEARFYSPRNGFYGDFDEKDIDENLDHIFY